MANALYVLFEIKHSDSKNKAVSQMRYCLITLLPSLTEWGIFSIIS